MPAAAGEKAGNKMEIATFAGGCFWCMEPPFENTPGVTSVAAGYTGGKKPNPSYEEVSSGATGHVEAVRVSYDPQKVTYEKILDVFWRNIDPTDEGGQFADSGSQYRPVIFYHTPEQKRLAEESKKRLQESGHFKKPIVVKVEPASGFYPAEDYHQDYYKKNPLRYKLYKKGSGREDFINRTWGKEIKDIPVK
ncbi:MAG: peptide-methionine (S)-S-oxide reductase MsrA [Nitrospinae bacterium]|nr:peptide-methionine (S)-S-oxide reductase MsrA [Nitrospinota bacterium]